MLMLPVSVGLGLININLLLNSTIGSRVSDEVPRAIDAAFRIYMLPQGMFSRRGGDGAVPAARAGSPRAATTRACRRTIGDRAAADRAAADPRRRGDARAARADGAAGLRARRVRRGVDAS